MSGIGGDSRLQSEVLESLSDARRYRGWLAELALPHLGDDPIEVGSGNGDYALEWAPHVRRLTVTEADPARLAALRDRFAGHPTIAVRELSLQCEVTAAHSAVVSYNVLEHIRDDVAALGAMARLAAPGAAVVLIVPAFPSAMGRFDRAIGHERRYTRASLEAALRAAGLAVEELRYVNPIGLLSWYLGVRALGMTPRDGAALRAYDRVVVPVSRWTERLVRPPFGQSVLAVARTR
jgi:SAM-dependent methyltransferase